MGVWGGGGGGGGGGALAYEHVLCKITVNCYAMVIMVYACCCATGYLMALLGYPGKT